MRRADLRRLRAWVIAARDREDVDTLLAFYGRGSRRRGLRERDRGGHAERCSRIRNSSTVTRLSPRTSRRAELPYQRRRARLASLFLALEQHPGRGAAHGGRAQKLATAGSTREAGAAHARGSEVRGADREFRGPMAQSASARRPRAARVAVPRFRRQSAPGLSARDGALVRQPVRENRPITDLITADYTFVNERLAKPTASRRIYGSRFQRVTLGPEFDARRGLLGKGSLLATSSQPSARRRCPRLLGAPESARRAAAAAAAERAELKPKPADANGTSAVDMREQMEAASPNPRARLSYADGSDRFRARAVRCGRHWRTTDGGSRSTAQRDVRRHEDQRARRTSAISS